MKPPKVKLNFTSRKMILKQEALEGVLPPTLFFIFLSNITEYMPKKVSHVLHADDLAFLDL